jgi:hypothetical protein
MNCLLNLSVRRVHQIGVGGKRFVFINSWAADVGEAARGLLITGADSATVINILTGNNGGRRPPGAAWPGRL